MSGGIHNGTAKNTPNIMNARPYSPDDLGAVQSWAAQRGMVLPQELIPRDAFVIEDENGEAIAFAALYFRIFAPVCSLDHFTTKPGLTGGMSLNAWKLLEQAALDRVLELRASGEADYRVIETFANQRLAQFAAELGYNVGETPHVLISKPIP